MNYMLLVYRDESRPTDIDGCDGLAERLVEAGKYVSGGILQSATVATSVRVRDGRRLVTDGPFAETREQLAGYLMIDAEDLDEALEVAAQHPIARIGTIEVRPVLQPPLS